MKFLIAGITILIWVCVMAGMTTLAATDSVVATVTARNISVIVEDGVVAYGTLNTGATNDTTASGEAPAANDTQAAGNNGNATADFNIQGTDSGNWEMVTGTPSGEEYRHRVATSAGNWTPLDEDNYQTLINDISASTTQDFDLEVLISGDTTQTAEQNVNVTVQAVTYE